MHSIIFCDIDGILHPLQSNGFSKVACSNVQFLLDKNQNARIVVSSSWRRWGLKKVREIFQEHGIDSSKIVDITGPKGGFDPQNRAEQIKTWLADNKEVKNFVAIDDYPLPELDPNFVKVNGYLGFTQKEAEIALRILNSGTTKST